MKQAPPLSSDVQGGGNWGDDSTQNPQRFHVALSSFSPAPAQKKLRTGHGRCAFLPRIIVRILSIACAEFLVGWPISQSKQTNLPAKNNQKRTVIFQER
jgi:hypothetical protein